MAMGNSRIYLLLFSIYSLSATIYICIVPAPQRLVRLSSMLGRNKNDTTDESRIPCTPFVPCVYDDDVDFRIIVITYNRHESLLKLLRSIDTVEMDGDKAAMEIWIDRNGKGEADDATVKTAESFNFSRGRKRVHIQLWHAGITGQWVDTWRPRAGSKEIGLILEDDVSVSPFVYRWLKAVHANYGSRTDYGGVTIQSDELKTLSPIAKTAWLSAPKNDTVFMYKCLGTWGFSPNPHHWAHYQDWLRTYIQSVAPHLRPYVPNAITTNWYKQAERDGTAETIWDMWFLYYMHIHQVFTIYNNLGVYTGNKESCLSINRREKGLHYPSKGPENLCRLMSVWKDEYVRFPKSIVRLDWDGTPLVNQHY